jgi:hypothetical protein
MRIAILLAVAATALLYRPSSGQAYYEGPWCAIVAVGSGIIAEDCHFRSLEECRPHVLAGNRGTCMENVRWPGYYAAAREQPRVWRERRGKRARHR